MNINIVSDDNKSETINERVRIIRKHHKISQVEFAKSLGIKQSTLSDIERGRIGVSANIISKISDTYYVSSDWILTGTPSLYHSKDGTIDVEKVRSLYHNNIVDNDNADEPYYGTLSTHGYEFKQIKYYMDLSTHTLEIHKTAELNSFEEIYNNNKKTIEFLHYLTPSDYTLTKKFKQLEDFKVHLQKIDTENGENISITGDAESQKLKLALQIIRYKEEKIHWDAMLTLLIDYLYIYKDLFRSQIDNKEAK